MQCTCCGLEGVSQPGNPVVRTSHEQTTSGVGHLSVDLSYHLDTHSRHESFVKKKGIGFG